MRFVLMMTLLSIALTLLGTTLAILLHTLFRLERVPAPFYVYLGLGIAFTVTLFGMNWDTVLMVWHTQRGF